MQILSLVAAAFVYAVGGIFMKHADGLQNVAWSVATFVTFGAGATLQAWAMRGRELAVTYLMVLGLEGVVAASFGFLLFKEELTVQKAVGMLLILAGTGMLRTA